MEFAKLKGFWKSSQDKTPADSQLIIQENAKPLGNKKVANANENNSSNVQRTKGNTKGSSPLEVLDEIRPEVTSEGYGLRTPYGTHLNLDFVKYCEDLSTGQTFKRTSSLRKPRSRTTSSSVLAPPSHHHNQHQQAAAASHRLAGGPSNESLDSLASEGPDSSKSSARADNTLMETRRRLEAFRSFRTKRNKSTDHPPPVTHQNGYNIYNSRGSISPGSSSGSVTPNSLGSILGSNQVTPQHLQIVREQMSAALSRLRELEDQVKTIPILQVKLSVLQQEKKHLLEELHKKEQLANIPPSPVNGYQHHNRDVDAFDSPDDKLSPRKSLLSTSSGISSSSSQSSINSPRSPNGRSTLSPPSLHRTLSSDPPLSPHQQKRGGPPPPPPKRKYRSVATGDPFSVWDIVCFSKSEKEYIDAGVMCEDAFGKSSSDVGSMVAPFDIDSAFNIFPPPPKEYLEKGVNTREWMTQDSGIQTCNVVATTQTQTEEAERVTVGCSDHVYFETSERSTETLSVRYADASCSVVPLPVETSSVETSSVDLIQFSDACVGERITTQEAQCSPVAWPTITVATDCDDLVTLEDKACDPHRPLPTHCDISTETDPLVKNVVSVGTDALPPPSTTSCASNTHSDEGKWCSYADLKDALAGPDACVAYSSVSTSTEAKTTRDQSLNTDTASLESKSVCADIRLSICDTETNTRAVETADSNTNTVKVDTVDCATAMPTVVTLDSSTSTYTAQLCHIATSTPRVSTADVSTDVDELLSDLARQTATLTSTFTNTTVIVTESNSTQYDSGVYDDDEATTHATCDASTDTSDLGETPAPRTEIDTYVDKVHSLLAEQQNLLAENYEDFAQVLEDDVDGGSRRESEKVSRFVNPAFASQQEEKEPEIKRTDAITASFSLMGSSNREEDDEEEQDSSEDEFDRRLVTLPPLPSPGPDFELKSIMRKPGTPVSEKKFLRFAEGVKSDESSSEEDYSSSEEESSDSEEVVDDAEEPEVVEQKSPKETTNVRRRPNKAEENTEPRWTYSDEFVKKSETTSVVEEPSQIVQEIDLVSQAAIPQQQVNLPTYQVHTKYQFTSEVLDACDVLEKHLRNPKSVDKSELALATSLVQEEWFRVAARVESSKDKVDDFVTDLADTSLPVLRKVVNMTDPSGNTVLHYAISHGKMDIVDLLLGIDELNVNRANHAGYTATMLASLCDLSDSEDINIASRLFEKSDINCHAKEAGQTALMLAVSHGRLRTTQMLVKFGAEINARDDDGSTALMCAAEHGHMEIVKFLLGQPGCDATLADNDGSTALSIAMESGRKEIAILLYAQANFKSNNVSKSLRPRQKCTTLIPSPARNLLKS